MSRGLGRAYQRGSVWWLDYTVGGQRHREPTDAATKRDAQDILRERIGNRKSGKVFGRPDRIMLAEYVKGEDGTETLSGGLRWLHETRYDLAELRSKERVVQCWAQIEKFFGAATRVTELTPTRLDEYAKARLKDGAARQTVNNELSALRAGLRLAVQKQWLATMPVKFDLPKVQNARQGFFEDGDFAAVLLELPAIFQAAIRFLRFTGWRATEPLSLTWDAIDWEGETIRLAISKNGEGRVFPFGLAPDLKALLEAQWEVRKGPFVFHRDGQRISYDSLEHQWARARKRAGLTNRLMHDLRRTAARDFRRAGVSEGEIMKLCGWKTRAMFDRYNIIDEADLASAVAKRFAPANGTVPAQERLSRRAVAA